MNKKNNNKFFAYFDGSCNPNPGGIAKYGAVIFHNNERIWTSHGLVKCDKGNRITTSNNVAEYFGFLSLLKYFAENNLQNEKITIYGDSKLVIKQMRGKWRILSGHYLNFALESKKILTKFNNVYIKWIPREANRLADSLSKRSCIDPTILNDNLNNLIF